jgi:creatinine amidohydrolase
MEGTVEIAQKVQIERMTWPEVKEAIHESNGIVIVPVGAVEEHGPHLPLGTDSIETYEIGLRAAEITGVVITPPIWYGNSRSFMDFPGTITVGPETLKLFTRDVVISLLKHGFSKPIILDGHSGNYGIMDILIEDLMLEKNVKVLHVRCWELATLPKPDGVPPYDGHAGSSETSAMMYLCASDVNEKSFVDSKPEIELTKYGSVFPSPSSLYSKGPVSFPMMMGEMVKSGHHGDPHFGSAERGKDLISVKVNALVEFINSIKADGIRFLKD